ncbi:MAG TPA: DUF1858 domain-containing protein [Caldisericia bacterium]|nr:DUF1858 domain-containing protein [Caldisericales bacterium]OQB72456.1 MAG: hypothetical protein BWX90_00876 [bacterium ADurb.Bin132]HNY60637.1 DUF1858 domain-containing protein [Caldisericia bacterium]HOC79677.1 DUF1858 domain-containing protein [Caldisericia bacterium]HOG70037.1 DUF1858 domain-containing protein [Caldisericia bacterium]
MEITLDTKIEKILEIYPSSSSFFARRGLVCYVCGEAFWGTLDELCQEKGVDPGAILTELISFLKQSQQ